MSQFTKGRWKVQPDQNSHGECLVICAGSKIIARTPVAKRFNDPVQIAIDRPNAQLIATAPAMFRELEKIARMETEDEINARTDDEGMSGDDAVETLSSLIRDARKIVAEAVLS